jgi:hypothetical protein
MRDIYHGVIGSLIAAFLIFIFGLLRTKLDLRLTRAHPRFSAISFVILSLLWITTITAGFFVAPSHSIPNVAIIILPSLAFFYFTWHELDQLWRVGLKGADQEIRNGISYRRSLELCKNSLDFLGIGASKLTREEEFEKALLRCRPDTPTRLLLLNPTDMNLKSAAKRAGKDEHEYKELVLNSLRKITEVKKRRELNVEVRFYKETPVFRLMFIDRYICLLSYNVFGEGDGSQLPQLHVLRAPETRREVTSFYYPLEQYFRRLWESSDPWNFSDFL